MGQKGRNPLRKQLDTGLTFNDRVKKQDCLNGFD